MLGKIKSLTTHGIAKASIAKTGRAVLSHGLGDVLKDPVLVVGIPLHEPHVDVRPFKSEVGQSSFDRKLVQLDACPVLDLEEDVSMKIMVVLTIVFESHAPPQPFHQIPVFVRKDHLVVTVVVPQPSPEVGVVREVLYCGTRTPYIGGGSGIEVDGNVEVAPPLFVGAIHCHRR